MKLRRAITKIMAKNRRHAKMQHRNRGKRRKLKSEGRRKPGRKSWREQISAERQNGKWRSIEGE